MKEFIEEDLRNKNNSAKLIKAINSIKQGQIINENKKINSLNDMPEIDFVKDYTGSKRPRKKYLVVINLK